MRSHKDNKIDLNNEYPCPCRRKGKLLPIVLTDAFGCDRCQQIFEVKENSVIEQLASNYPYKRAWRWSGSRWVNNTNSLGESYLLLTLGIIIVLLIFWLPMALQSSSGGILLLASIAILMAILPAVIAIFTYRR